MISRFCFILFLILVGNKCYSQKDSLIKARNLLYVEVIGVGGYGSINYERTIYAKRKMMLAMRIGKSTYNIRDFTNTFNPDIIVPVLLNGCYGNKHKLEFGFGKIFTNVVRADYINFTPKRTTNYHVVLSTGYRFQKDSKGVFFRIAYTPVLEFNKYLRHSGGLSFGYSF